MRLEPKLIGGIYPAQNEEPHSRVAGASARTTESDAGGHRAIL